MYDELEDEKGSNEPLKKFTAADMKISESRGESVDNEEKSRITHRHNMGGSIDGIIRRTLSSRSMPVCSDGDIRGDKNRVLLKGRIRNPGAADKQPSMMLSHTIPGSANTQFQRVK